MKLRYYLALWAGKLSVFALRLLKRRGTVLPGRIALAICPQFIRMASRPATVIAVTGTNGKTTVTNMLTDLLRADGRRVLSNPSGANEHDGLATMLVRGLSPAGKCRHEIYLYEVDEHHTSSIFPQLEPNLLLVTNLTRDSITRNAHPDYVAELVQKAIPPSTRLLLNADNMLSAFLAPQNPRVYFGVDRLPSDGQVYSSLIHDAVLCPHCGRHLVWEVLHYSDIGRARCPHCGLSSPRWDYWGAHIDLENMCFDLQDARGSVRCALPHPSIFNVYNAVAAAAVLCELGYTRERITRLYKGLKIVDTRFHRECVGQYTLCRMMAKALNAFAESCVFEYLQSLPGKKEIVFMSCDYGDSPAQSDNTAWIYDCDFELLNSPEFCTIVLYGARAQDYKLRLLLAGVPEERIRVTKTAEEMPAQLRLFDGDSVFVLYGADNHSAACAVSDSIRQRMEEKVRT